MSSAGRVGGGERLTSAKDENRPSYVTGPPAQSRRTISIASSVRAARSARGTPIAARLRLRVDAEAEGRAAACPPRGRRPSPAPWRAAPGSAPARRGRWCRASGASSARRPPRGSRAAPALAASPSRRARSSRSRAPRAARRGGGAPTGERPVAVERADADADADAHALRIHIAVSRPAPVARPLQHAVVLPNVGRKARKGCESEATLTLLVERDRHSSSARRHRSGGAPTWPSLCVAAGCGGSGSTASATTTASAGTHTGVTATGASLPRPLAGTVAHVRRGSRGIPQHSLVLGSPTAPVTIVEYGHFACPTCAAAHRTVVPEVIERYVRTGKASLEFRGIGGDTPSRARDLALSAAAASAQRRGWEYVQLAYLRGLEKPRRRAGDAVGIARPARDGPRPRHGGVGRRARPAVPARAGRGRCQRRGRGPVLDLSRVPAPRADEPEQPFVVLTAPSSVGAFATAIAEGAAPTRLTPSPAAP